MPRSWTQNYYHIVFSTKRREQTVSPEIESRLYPFIGGILKDFRCTTLAINGRGRGAEMALLSSG